MDDVFVKPHVSIIVLNYNRWLDTICCLESLLRLTYQKFEVIIIDNCSSDDSWGKFKEWSVGEYVVKVNASSLSYLQEPPFPKPIDCKFLLEQEMESDKSQFNHGQLTFIRANKNRGYSAGNNIGIRYAQLQNQSQYFWILNNDTLVTENSLIELLKCHQYYKFEDKIGIIGGKILYFDEPNIVQCLGGATYDPYLGAVRQLNNGQHSNEVIYEGKPVDYICGACMLVTSDFVKEVGLLSEEFFLYYEELDWCIRGKKMGWNLAYTDTCKIFHKEGSTTGSNRKHKNKLVDYYSLRNRIMILKRYYSRKHLIVFYIVLIFTALNQLLKGNTFRISNLWKLVTKT
ncbi:hypothetical protein BN8_06379 [Fibrisoma limi BUZ 3]|uniref:Glycosyltransferase 2-like domain-containing protein n=1 Tax=Fibrisoma limi BUZ 3 TaxID=1185876 RepID=I2GSV6_9BACT|nr:glycosyltransferase family 2 protein [Fibrisoma limi]CCH56985.1 hypothetical protein BN8_06379 [Fibrisoma limi BUZ 3]